MAILHSEIYKIILGNTGMHLSVFEFGAASSRFYFIRWSLLHNPNNNLIMSRPPKV